MRRGELAQRKVGARKVKQGRGNRGVVSGVEDHVLEGVQSRSVVCMQTIDSS